MYIQSTEVKTFYEIFFTWKDFEAAKKKFKKDPQNILDEYKLAFSGLGPDYTGSDIYNLLNQHPLISSKNAEAIKVATLRYIIKRYFKFDGISWYGMAEEYCYKLTVYNYGDHLNLPVEEGGKKICTL